MAKLCDGDIHGVVQGHEQLVQRNAWPLPILVSAVGPVAVLQQAPVLKYPFCPQTDRGDGNRSPRLHRARTETA